MSFWNQKDKWKRSAKNTGVCLTGCAIGDFGALIYFAAKAPQTPLMTQMIVAIICGITTSIILETLVMRFKESFTWWESFKVACGMSLISMIAMEIAMNAVDFSVNQKFGFTIVDLGFWLTFIPALVAGFLTSWPYNYWRLVKFNKSCCAAKKTCGSKKEA